MKKNPIIEMRERLRGGYKSSPQIRVTADDSPRLPQSNISSPKPKYSRAGRPAKPRSRTFGGK